MKTIWLFIIILIVVVVIVITAPPINTNKPKTLHLTSSAFIHNSLIPVKYTCDGVNFSPPLSISGVPTNAKSLVLIMDDPDSPTGTWDHWIIFNLPTNTTELKEGLPPPGVLGQGTTQEMNYQGPCPGSGQHRYFFKLYALVGFLTICLRLLQRERANGRCITHGMRS